MAKLANHIIKIDLLQILQLNCCMDAICNKFCCKGIASMQYLQYNCNNLKGNAGQLYSNYCNYCNFL